jgi:hypothetical protein
MTRLGWVPALALLAAARSSAQVALPDSPGFALTTMESSSSADAGAIGAAFQQTAPLTLNPPPCASGSAPAPATITASGIMPIDRPCPANQNQIRPFVDANRRVVPLTVRQKGRLAIRDIRDPFNALTVAGNAAYTVASTPHGPYGPGMRGFGYDVGVSYAQEATGEFIGTFAVCSIFHQDPRYFRMPHASIPRRVLHAASHVIIAQGDNGRPMPNYENLITAAASNEIANTYVPGLATDQASTWDRMFSGFLSEPIGLFIAEFLPDIASRIHVNIVIMQRYIDKIAAQQGPQMPAGTQPPPPS